MIFAGYRVNLDALLARMVYRWRWSIIAGGLALLLLTGLIGGYIPPFWRGQADIHIQAAPGAAITVDGRLWQAGGATRIYAGKHTIVATTADGRRSWTELNIKPGEAMVITLPDGLPPPRERQLPPAAPGMHIKQIWRSGDAWRVQSETTPGDPDTAEPVTLTISVDTNSIERLTTIDAYRGLADLTYAGGMRYEAIYEPALPGIRSEGTLTIHGWNIAPLTIAGEVSFVRFAPDGQALILAEHAAAGEHISYLARGRSPVSLVAVPGIITGVAWRPDSSALLIASRDGDQRALTLARLNPAPVAAVIAEPPVDGLPAYAWADNELLWTAPDDEGEPWLWRAAIETLLPERENRLDARAMTILADGTPRIMTIQQGRVVIGRWQNDLFIAETMLNEALPAKDLIGEWYGNDILLRSGDHAWLITVTEGAQQ